MKTKVTQTSLDSYNTDIKDKKEVTQKEKVFNVIKRLGKASNNEIARRLGVYPSTVSARANKLFKEGRIEREEETKKDMLTDKANNQWKVKK